MHRRFVVAAIGGMVLFPAAAEADKLVHLPLTEGSGNTTANTGTLGGTADIQAPGTWLADGPGFLPAVDYGADRSYTTGISLSTGTALQGLSQYTVTTWVRVNETLHTEPPNTPDVPDNLWNFGAGGSVGSEGPNLWLWGNNIVGHDGSNQRDLGPLPEAEYLDQWKFVAFVFDAGTGTSYVGSETDPAVLRGTASGFASPSPGTPTQLEIGGSTITWGVNALPAAFGDVRVYDTALSAAEVEAIRLEAIPEPTSLGLLALGGLALVRRRR